jgi:hypothetical protein
MVHGIELLLFVSLFNLAAFESAKSVGRKDSRYFSAVEWTGKSSAASYTTGAMPHFEKTAGTKCMTAA